MENLRNTVVICSRLLVPSPTCEEWETERVTVRSAQEFMQHEQQRRRKDIQGAY